MPNVSFIALELISSNIFIYYQNMEIFQTGGPIKLVITDQLYGLHVFPKVHSLVCMRQDSFQIACNHEIRR